VYCPGSSFKPITAAIALNSKKLDPQSVKDIKGLAWQKDKSWGNYYINRVKAYDKPSNLLNALVYSDNIYFAQLALDIGEDTFKSETVNFGIGEKVPFDFELTASQFDSDGILRNQIQLADSGYGQGEVLMNPLHLALIYSAFVNGGNIPKPKLTFSENPTAGFWKENVISSETAKLIAKDLEQVVKSPEGTGHQAFMKNLPLAGKTGTAEIKMNKADKNGTELGWFAAVNTENPALLAVVMVEDVKTRGGSHYAVPIVKKVFQSYFKK
jgi:penicillin-binding protein